MIRRQLVNLGDSGCVYRIGCGALAEFSSFAKTITGVPRRCAFVVPAGAPEDVLTAVTRGLIDAGFAVEQLTLDAEAPLATVAVAAQIQSFLAASHITRDDAIISIGEQDIESVVDYVALTWCGGTSCGHVPLTLDSMCLAATHMQPLAVGEGDAFVHARPKTSLVVCDLDLVISQPADARALGTVLMLKAAMTDSKRAWDRFGEKIPGYLAGEEVAYVDLLCGAQTAWSGILKASNPSARRAFDYGITTARALKACLGDALPDYQLLAEGMRFEARLGHEVFDLDIDYVFEQDDRLEDLGIEEASFSIEPAHFLEALRETVFAESNKFMFSLPKTVGTIRLTSVDDDVLERHATAYLKSRADLD